MRPLLGVLEAAAVMVVVVPPLRTLQLGLRMLRSSSREHRVSWTSANTARLKTKAASGRTCSSVFVGNQTRCQTMHRCPSNSQKPLLLRLLLLQGFPVLLPVLLPVLPAAVAEPISTFPFRAYV